MRYYCLHHTPAIDRKQYLLNFFETHQLNVEWIEDFLPDSEIVLNHPKIESCHAANGSKILNNGEISLFLKHLLAIDKIRTIDDYGVIFEDDIKDVDFNLNETISKFVELAQENSIDVLWIGSSDRYSCNLQPSEEPKILSNNNTKTRLTHCYMIHSNTAQKVYDEFANIKHPTDWQWNYVIDKLNLKSAWSYPHIYQRTDTKETPSLLR
jgi:GR25 family glycosyltransferase involved in LPS biosynthesis